MNPIRRKNNQPTIIRPAWRLVIDQLTWRQSLRELLRNRQLWGIGAIELHSTNHERELIVRGIEMVDAAVGGSAKAPLANWLLMRVLPPGESISSKTLSTMATSLSLSPLQLLAVVVLDGEHFDRWDGCVIRSGKMEPIDEVHLIGRGLLRLERTLIEQSNRPSMPSELQQRRSSRLHPVLGDHVIRSIRNSTVTLVGAGRNGWKMAFELAGVGVGKMFRIVDPDILDWENIDFMPGIRARDVRRSKGRVLADALMRFRPELAVAVLEQSTTRAVAQRFLAERSDLLVTAVDNDLARTAVSIVARQTLTVHLDVATEVQRDSSGSLSITGDARLLLPGHGCTACVGSVPEVDELLEELDGPPGTLPRRRRLGWERERLGSLGSINSMTCGAAAQMWLDLIMGAKGTSYWQRLSWNPVEGLIVHCGSVDSLADCRICHGPAKHFG